MSTPTYVIVRHRIDGGDKGMENVNPPILVMLSRALLALATSALLLFITFVVYLNFRIAGTDEHVAPIAIAGKSMQAVVGSAESRGEALAITAYHAEQGELSAAAVWRGRFQAADYPLLAYQIGTVFPGPEFKLIWRTTRDPDVLHNTQLSVADNELSWLDLSRIPEWQGTVVELGVYAFANAADDALSIDHLSLETLGWHGALASHWTDWTAFRGWTTRSINFLYGTVDEHALSPVVVAAAWTALAIGVLLIAGLFAGGLQPGALVAVLLVPWICVDLLWQRELMSQLTQTRSQFAGKTLEQKHLADIDGNIYRYITRLKNDVLPKTPTRVIVLHNSQGHNFERLKAQYYLLPHRVYNFGRKPPKSGLATVDYILVLGEIPGLEFDLQTSKLVWKKGKRSLAVEQVDKESMGALFRVAPDRVAPDRGAPDRVAPDRLQSRGVEGGHHDDRG